MPTRDEFEASEVGELTAADPSGLVRGVGSVFAIWGTALIACHFAFHWWHFWTLAIGLAFWAGAIAARPGRQPA